MTETMMAHSSFTDNLGSMASTVPIAAAAPKIEMLPNPDFSFPRIPLSDASPSPPRNARALRRPVSVNMDAQRSQMTERSHRRGVSMLPSFSFNASDSTGLSVDQTEPMQTSPMRGGHRRNTSELVGGKGMVGAVSASPTKSAPLAVPGHRGHKSRASRVTLSSSDWSAVMADADVQPRLSSSLPNTPLEHPALQHAVSTACADPFGPPSVNDLARPPSRPRVEFSENVEYIPRPLSTISSETESSMSTVRGHSVNNSISSVLSLSTPSAPAPRPRAISLETTMEDEPRPIPRSSIEISKRIEKEGQWLKRGTSHESLQRPVTQPAPAPTRLKFAAASENVKPRTAHKKKHSLGSALGFDRRRSEPAIGMQKDIPSRLSTISLQEAALQPKLDDEENAVLQPRSSSRKFKDWAVSKISRRSKDPIRPHSVYLVPSPNPQHIEASPISEPAVAETDLDAVFSLEADESAGSATQVQRVEIESPSFATNRTFQDFDDSSAVLDLDAALGPFKTPPLGSQKPRRELHSSRGTRDFFGPGGHYQPGPSHRRAESAPMLTPWDYVRTGTPPQAGMADVFEEEEEEDEARMARPVSTSSAQDEESRMGVQIVDSDISADNCTPGLSLDDGLRLQHGEWEPERPSTSYSTMSSRLSMPRLDRRASSIIEDTIIEEASPIEPAIVEYHEEPRAQSLTKSSDTSETPTVLGNQTVSVSTPDGQSSLTTAENYQTSAFSTPDFAVRQTSFDTSRIGTSASSMTDNRTMSSCTTGEPMPDVRMSVDDTPSLTSSRSTMLTTSHANSSRRDISGLRTPSVASGTLDATLSHERRYKRASIQSLSQLLGPRPATGMPNGRPSTAATDVSTKVPKKKEHRLKKLMFWKSKHRQASTSTIS